MLIHNNFNKNNFTLYDVIREFIDIVINNINRAVIIGYELSYGMPIRCPKKQLIDKTNKYLYIDI